MFSFCFGSDKICKKELIENYVINIFINRMNMPFAMFMFCPTCVRRRYLQSSKHYFQMFGGGGGGWRVVMRGGG